MGRAQLGAYAKACTGSAGTGILAARRRASAHFTATPARECGCHFSDGRPGRSQRADRDRRKGLGPLHSVSIWATEFGLTLGQVATDDKSNEITAIPELLRLVDLQGAIMTIDAMGTQKAIAQQIVDTEADFVLALKAGHDREHEVFPTVRRDPTDEGAEKRIGPVRPGGSAQ